MKEILPGIYHWTQAHPKIKIDVSSYYLKPERALIDPLIPDEGLDWFAEFPPENIYLSIRHHYRHCGEFRKEYGCTVWCVEQGGGKYELGMEFWWIGWGDDGAQQAVSGYIKKALEG